MPRNYVIEYVESGSGRCRVAEFIDGLEPETQAKIDVEFDLLEEFGLEVGGPYVRKVDKKYNIWELRVIHGGRWYRFFLVTRPGRRIIVLHAYQKKGNRIPKPELDIARRIAAEV